MGSKTRLSSHCSKRGDNTVNLVMSRKTNVRLARPIADLTLAALPPVYYPAYTAQNYLYSNLDFDLVRDQKDVSFYTGHSLFNTTKCITLLYIVQSLLHHNPPYISGMKLSRSRCVYTEQNFLIQIAI